MEILKAEFDDLEEILNLQYLAYISEAELLDDFNIEPLHQKLEEVQKEYKEGIILKGVTDDNRIIASVRASVKNNTLYIGKLIVHPDFENKGIGSKLINEIEKYGTFSRAELFTSSKSPKNLHFYKKNGYKPFKKEFISEQTPKAKFIYFEKNF